MVKYNGTAQDREALRIFVSTLVNTNCTDSVVIKTLTNRYESGSLFEVISDTETFMYSNRAVDTLIRTTFPELLTDAKLSGADAIDRLRQLLEEIK